MHSLIAAMLVLGACGGGAYVEVHTNGLDVTEVELVTGIDDCRTLDGERCDSIIGDSAVGFTTSMGERGDLYERGPTGVATVSGGVATFELDPALPLPVAFVIGRDIQGQVIGVAVVDHTIDDTGGPIIYRVDLDPAENLFASQRDPAKAGITQWGTTDRCIGIAPIRPARRDPIFILPHDNPDCDAITGDPMECNPLWFDGMQLDESTAPHCVVRSTRIGTTDSNPCVLGHQPRCAEVMINPNQMPCIETHSCLPDAVCSTSDSCSDFNEVCQQSILLGTAGPREACVAPGEADGGGGSQPCPNGIANTLGINLIADPISKVEFIVPPAAGVFAPYHGQRSDRIKIGLVEFKLTRSGSTISIERTGSGPANLAIDTIVVFTTIAPMTNVEHEIWIPITLALSTTGCAGGAAPCTIDGAADAVFSCGAL